MLGSNDHTVICNEGRLVTVHEGEVARPVPVLFGSTRHAVFDFDGTVTPGSQWRAMAKLMLPPLAAIDRAAYEWYHSHQFDDLEGRPLADPDDPWSNLDARNLGPVEGAWVAQTICLLAMSNVSANAIRHQAEQVGVRHGFLDLARLMQRRAIITFGTKQFPLWWCEHHGIADGMDIRGAHIHFNGNGLVTHSALNVCTGVTKGHDVERWMIHHGVREGELMVIGDSVVDARMFRPGSTNVLLVPRQETERALAKFRRDNLASIWPNVDIVLHSDSLSPLAQMIRAARRSGS